MTLAGSISLMETREALEKGKDQYSRPPYWGNLFWNKDSELFQYKNEHCQSLNTRKPNWIGRISTVDLPIKVACFVTKIKNIFNRKMNIAEALVQGNITGYEGLVQLTS